MKCKLCPNNLDNFRVGIGGIGLVCMDCWTKYMEEKKKALQGILDIVKEPDLK